MSRFRDMKIPAKIALAFGAVLSLTAVCGGISLYANKVVDRASQANQQAAQAEASAAALLSMVQVQQGSLRAFLLTGDPTTLEAYDAGKAGLDAALDGILAHTTDAQARSDVDRMHTALTGWYGTVADPQIALMRHPATVEEARALEVSGAGERIVAEVTNLATALIHRERAAALTRLSELEQAQVASFWALLGGSLLAALVAVVAGVTLSRGIGRPVVAMTDAMGSLADGNHDVTIPATERGDEIGRMAKAVLVFKENMIRAKELADQEAEAQKRRALRA